MIYQRFVQSISTVALFNDDFLSARCDNVGRLQGCESVPVFATAISDFDHDPYWQMADTHTIEKARHVPVLLAVPQTDESEEHYNKRDQRRG